MHALTCAPCFRASCRDPGFAGHTLYVQLASLLSVLKPEQEERRCRAVASCIEGRLGVAVLAAFRRTAATPIHIVEIPPGLKSFQLEGNPGAWTPECRPAAQTEPCAETSSAGHQQHGAWALARPGASGLRARTLVVCCMQYVQVAGAKGTVRPCDHALLHVQQAFACSMCNLLPAAAQLGWNAHRPRNKGPAWAEKYVHEPRVLAHPAFPVQHAHAALQHPTCPH